MAISGKVRAQMEQSSWIRRMFEQGIRLKNEHGASNVFDLSLGNPILEPPAEFRDGLARVARDAAQGTHRYMPNPGYPETRGAVADALSSETGLNFGAGDVIMTVGAGGAINTILRALLDPGDEVVIFAPFFAEYIFYIEHQNGTPKIARCDDAFLPDIDSLRNAFSARTKAVMINSPNNPTGVVYPESTVAEIGVALREAEARYGTEIALISDEPYRKLIYTDEPYPFIYSHHPRSVVATSHSKDLGLAGERIGYIAVNPDFPGKTEFLDAAVFALRTLGFVNAPALMQRVVAGLQHASVDIGEYRRRRDFLYEALTDIGYHMPKPEGAFYMFPKSPLDNDVEFVNLLQSKLVLVVPGSGFGTPGYFRLSFCVDDHTLEGCVEGFREAFEEAAAR